MRDNVEHNFYINFANIYEKYMNWIGEEVGRFMCVSYTHIIKGTISC